MAVTIRNWKSFPVPIGEIAIEALGLTAQGGESIYGAVSRLSTDFVPFAPGTDADTLTFSEIAGIDEVRLDGVFSAGSGRVTALNYFDDVTYSGADPVAGVAYSLSGGRVDYNAASGLSGTFQRMQIEDYAGAYTADLRGTFAAQTGKGAFSTGVFEIAGGAAYRVSGDMRLDASGLEPVFSGTIRSLELLGPTGKVLGTARGLKIDASDFATGAGSLASSAIFAGNDNVTLGKGGAYFEAWGGNDRVIGGNGGDTIVGGDGKDVLTGGAGADVFVLTGGSVVTTTYQADLITDFSVCHDVLVFDLYIFTALDEGRYFDPVTGELQLDLVFEDEVLDYSRGVVYYDADGSGEAFGRVAVVKLSGNPDLGPGNISAEGFVPI